MYIVGITGASGPILGIRLIEELLKSGCEVSSIVSGMAWKILDHEMGGGKNIRSIRKILEARKQVKSADALIEYANDDLFSPPASGSTRFRAVIVIPCSMKTLSSISRGYADTLITRAADVALKEGRQCIVVPRETPLNLMHIRNMLMAKEAGVDIVLPVPAYYTFPKTIDDVTDHIVGRVLDLLGIDNRLYRRWGEDA